MELKMANAHPAIIFRVDLNLLRNEGFGPNTNSSSQGTLHPDMFQSNPDQGVTDSANHSASLSTFIPGVKIGPNFSLKHGAQFTLYGMEAVYAKKMYCPASDGGEAASDRAVLRIVE
jgi:hypothetical protein